MERVELKKTDTRAIIKEITQKEEVTLKEEVVQKVSLKINTVDLEIEEEQDSTATGSQHTPEKKRTDSAEAGMTTYAGPEPNSKRLVIRDNLVAMLKEAYE